ncbi:MAG: hypothetical protein NTY45_04770 [Elusimicrobia bacterium]|nr:hypothetical protein [Elusimicrobiota bacterium]
MNRLNKTIIGLTLLIAAVLYSGATASASGFNLTSVSAANVGAGIYKTAAPRPSAPAADELIGTDLTIKVPFMLINKLMLTVDCLSIVEPGRPTLERSGKLLKVVNLRLDVNGIIIEPVITLKPYLEGRDKLAVRVEHVQMHAGAAPTPGASGIPSAIPTPDNGSVFNIEDTMADVMGIITKGIRDAINEKLQESHSDLTSAEIIASKYDKAAWTLHAVISPAVLKNYLSDSLVGEVHMTGFGFNDSAILIKLESKR